MASSEAAREAQTFLGVSRKIPPGWCPLALPSAGAAGSQSRVLGLGRWPPSPLVLCLGCAQGNDT